MKKTSPCCNAAIKKDERSGQVYCINCGLIIAELMYTTEITYKEGITDREFVTPLWWNTKQTKNLTRNERMSVLYSRKLRNKLSKTEESKGEQ